MSLPESRPSVEDLWEGILRKDRILLARAITLVESKHPDDAADAHRLLDFAAAHPSKSQRIGITGVPGVGKSTFIDVFGSLLTDMGKSVAVLSVDPSSSRTRGSILGDKTRMNRLSANPKAYIRPSPAGNTLGGVAQRTREAMMLCEAAGFEVILVETVGVGQSETLVRDMVDCFLLLMLAGGGDELQGVKRGIMEMADVMVVHKADGANVGAAKKAAKALGNALHLLPASPSGWIVPVSICSSLTSVGVNDIWKQVESYFEHIHSNGFLEIQRRDQQLAWFRQMWHERMNEKMFASPEMNTKRAALESEIQKGTLSVRHAVDRLFEEMSFPHQS